LVAFSDGVTEARSSGDEEFGEERLVSIVEANWQKTPDALLDCLLGTVHQFSAGAEQSDDLTLLILRYDGRK
jgi:phosphoserine phosphatase RsbU/P